MVGLTGLTGLPAVRVVAMACRAGSGYATTQSLPMEAGSVQDLL